MTSERDPVLVSNDAALGGQLAISSTATASYLNRIRGPSSFVKSRAFIALVLMVVVHDELVQRQNVVSDDLRMTAVEADEDSDPDDNGNPVQDIEAGRQQEEVNELQSSTD
ncbi:hypothetical protein CSOJ01_13290 [Colletotrichum sojae]|uniref:Uncharacterized protein n=1 Tax=Colletotrichum sojae TaxID=2175907 RepID=A0A8H6ITK6_9PEZI|nr:hypothetical protein CSOJ01_13290 [Colletotrichum sojae]